MGSEIGADVPLDYVTFQILPENRYGASICSEEKEEMVKDGPLELLLEHLPSIKDQIIEGSCDNFKLELPNSVTTKEWFTKSTLMRFLHVIGSSDALKKSVAISNEMSQLEETRKFHLSLYTQADKMSGSDNSKNELLRAMDSRIAVLTEELLLTFDLAAGSAFSFKEMIDLREFCQHFGDVDIRTLLVKLSEKSKKTRTITPVTNKKSPIPLVSKNDYINKISKNIQTSRDSNSLKPIQYDASPAKAAEIERQSSTESDDDESSNSSEDERPSPPERSRTLIRSASPRRSASPMRKVQIGRSGSRRTPALTIKSLPYFPARERIPSFREMGNDVNNEESEEPNRKPEINVTRMSVQDAISLFESRQRDQTNEGQKKVGVENSTTNTNKAVLRRWSSGMSESQKSMMPEIVDPTASENNGEDKEEHTRSNAEIEEDDFRDFENEKFEETVKTDMGLEGSKDIASKDVEIVNQTEEDFEKLDSAEWTRQKEEELNKMLMKFAEYNLNNNKNADPDNKKTKQVSRTRQSGIVNGQLKEKRDVKSTGEKTVKKVEKPSGIRAPKQRVSDKPKPERSSPKVNDSVKKLPASRTSSINKSGPPSSNPKKESLKPALPKKAPSKTSSLPATRKSWPSTPSPRVSGTLPTRSPTITPTSTSAPRQKSQSPAPRQKPQSPGPVSGPGPKVEKPQIQQKEVKKPQLEPKKSVKKVDDPKTRLVPKNGQTTKIKTVAVPEEDTPVAVSPAKGAVRKKVTKKSSVVPLEVKPSVRKVAERSPVESQKREIVPSEVEETLSKNEDTHTDVNNVGITPDKNDSMKAQDSEAQNNEQVELETESETRKPENGTESEVSPQGDGVRERMMDSPLKDQIQPAQESVISPTAWVENDQQDTTIILPHGDNSSSSMGNTDVVGPSGIRVRHSLSQMLLEESSEPDIIEWGNAEHPPSMVFQKDAPKGLKRLLKFARKNKEGNGSSWASPYTSEGEEDGDEYRSLGKGKSDNLLKVALHSKNYAEGFLSDNEPLSARSNASNISSRSSNKFQDGHGSSKGARSFFSLSAFRGKN